MAARVTTAARRAAPSWLTADRLEVIGAVLVTLVVSRNLWLPGRYLSGFDTVAYSGPNLEVTMDAWRSGRLALWNDSIFGGVVHLANPQAGVLYPPKMLALVFDTNQAMGLIVLAHLLLLSLGMLFLVRRLGCRPPAGFVAATVVVANGVVLTRSIQFEQIIVLSWVPLLLLGITAVLSTEGDRRPWAAMAGTAFVTAMALTAGHPQITYHVVFLAGLWTVAMVVRHRWGPRVFDLAAAIGVGVLMAAPHLVAALAGTSDSSLDLGREPEQLLVEGKSVQYTTLLHTLWGTVRDTNEALFVGSFETIGHVGVAVTILALAGIGVLWRRDERAIAAVLVVLAGLGIVWALGPRTFVFDAAYEIVPGFDAARVAARWMNLLAIAAAIAVAFGIDGLRSTTARPSVVLPVVGLGGVALLVAATSLGLPDGATVAAWVVVAVLLIGLLAAAARWPHATIVTTAVVVVVVAELAGLSRSSSIDAASSRVSFDELSAAPGDALADRDGLSIAFTDDLLGDTAYLVPGFRPNTNTLADVRSIDGYDGGVQITERWVALIEDLAANPAPDLPIRNNVPLPFTPEVGADLFVRWIVFDDDRSATDVIPGWTETDLEAGEFTVYENPEWVGPAQGRSDDGVRALPTDRPDPETVTVEAGGAGDAERIVVDQQFAPGWTAEADGNDVDVVAADDFFLAADVPAGTQSVTFRYRPAWLLPSLVVGVR
ncbi:MAG: hypothetical protein AAGK32_04395, partial [Actinomycetota bacterium]